MKKNLVLIIGIVIIFSGAWYHFCSANSKVINMVAIGDSITYGTGDPTKKGYIKRVKVRLEEERGIPVQLNNYAIPGFTTENILKQLRDRSIKKRIEKADYLILYIGTNDFRKSAEYQFNPLHLEKINEGESRFSGNLRIILEKMRHENSTAPIIVLGLYHPYAEFPNQQEIHEVIEHWNNEISQVTGDFDQAYFIPTLDLFQNQPKEMYFSDSLHLNPAAYQLIANRLLNKVMDLERDIDTKK